MEEFGKVVKTLRRSKSAQRLLEEIHKIPERKDHAKKVIAKLVKKLDESTNARSTFFLVFVFYLLGKSLNYYLILILFLYLYLLSYRFVRFWVKNSLMYMLDFIYFGNIALIIFLVFDRNNRDLFLTVYSCATGVISLTIIIDNNEIELGDTDFVTSTFLDSIPVLTTFAIRWKHILYNKYNSNLVFELGDLNFVWDDTMKKLIYFPISVWFLWGLLYFALNGKILRKFAYSELFESTICKFYHSNSLGFLLGDHKKFTILKYLIIQFMYLIIAIPLVLLNFYNFYFSCGYIIFIIVYIGYNSARGKEKRMKDLIKEANGE